VKTNRQREEIREGDRKQTI